jgi:hypothetical protein
VKDGDIVTIEVGCISHPIHQILESLLALSAQHKTELHKTSCCRSPEAAEVLAAELDTDGASSIHAGVPDQLQPLLKGAWLVGGEGRLAVLLMTPFGCHEVVAAAR